MSSSIANNVFSVLCGVSLAKVAAAQPQLFSGGGPLTFPLPSGSEGQIIRSGRNRWGPYMVVQDQKTNQHYFVTPNRYSRTGLKFLPIPAENVARIPDYTAPQQFGSLFQAQQLRQWAPRFGFGGADQTPNLQTIIQQQLLPWLQQIIQHYIDTQLGGPVQQGSNPPMSSSQGANLHQSTQSIPAASSSLESPLSTQPSQK